jgi:DNA-binding response OmpR family regulator
VIESEAAVPTELKESLSTTRWQTDYAAADKALQAIRGMHPDLVLIAQTVPGTTVVSLLGEIADLPDSGQLPVYAIYTEQVSSGAPDFFIDQIICK